MTLETVQWVFHYFEDSLHLLVLLFALSCIGGFRK